MAYQSSSNCYSVDVSYCRNFHTSVFTRFFVAFTETRFHDKSVPKFLTVRILIIIIRKTHIVRPMLCSWLRGRFLRTFTACFCIIESTFLLIAWFAKFAKIFLLGWLCPIRSDTLTLNLYPGRIPSVACSYFMRLDAKHPCRVLFSFFQHRNWKTFWLLGIGDPCHDSHETSFVFAIAADGLSGP